jgi:tetratricopeptide (TPR) repeat protein
MTGRLIALVFVLLGAAWAQSENGSSDVVPHLRVRVSFSDHAPCDPSTRVILTRGRDFAPAESSANGECVAEFFDVPSGKYRVTVSGAVTSSSDQRDVEVNPAISPDLEVRAKHSVEADPIHWAASASFVPVTDLGLPANAAREFERANRLIAKQDWRRATERLHKGLAIYPRYAAGYNNLGAIYSQLGNEAQAREALEQAITLDDHLAPAYVNLGRLSFLQKDFPSAESLLTRAITLAPAANADELFLLAYSQLTDHHLDQALQTCRQGHATKLDRHALLHLVAANAYEQQSKIEASISELELYLSEEPSGPQADKARNALTKFRAQPSVR